MDGTLMRRAQPVDMIRGSLLYMLATPCLVSLERAGGCACVPETPLMTVIGHFAQFMLGGSCRSSEDMDAFHESSDLMEGA